METDETSVCYFKVCDQLEVFEDNGHMWNWLVRHVGYYIYYEDEDGFGKEYYVDNIENNLRRVGVHGIPRNKA